MGIHLKYDPIVWRALIVFCFVCFKILHRSSLHLQAVDWDGTWKIWCAKYWERIRVELSQRMSWTMFKLADISLGFQEDCCPLLVQVISEVSYYLIYPFIRLFTGVLSCSFTPFIPGSGAHSKSKNRVFLGQMISWLLLAAGEFPYDGEKNGISRHKEKGWW